MRYSLLVYFLATWLLVSAGAASACSCFPPSAQQLLQRTPLIFHGKVLKASRESGIAVFAVDTVYKGAVPGATFEMQFNNSDGASCGIGFKEGAEEMVFAYPASYRGQPEVFTTDYCSMMPYASSPIAYQPALDQYRLQTARARGYAAAHARDTAAWERLAGLQEKAGDWLQAVVTLDTLSALQPGAAVYKSRKADALMGLGRHETALAAYRQALLLDPAFAPAKKGLDQALAKLGRVRELDPARRDYAGMELSKADFSMHQLAGADYARARLSGVNFHGAVLSGANFNDASLHTVDFSGARLDRAQLTKIDAYNTDFSDASLPGANLREGGLGGAKFGGADLGGADFSGARLEGAVFRQAKLAGAIFDRANLYRADFAGTDLTGRNFSGMQMQGIVLRGAVLRNANLEGAMLAGPLAGYRENESLHGPGRGADLRGTDMRGARLKGADLRFALFDCKTRWPEGFDPLSLPLLPVSSADCPGPPPKTALFKQKGDLRESAGRIGGERAKLRGAEFENANFDGADLAGANLSGFRFWSSTFVRANLAGTDLRNADLQNAVFANADMHGADLGGATLSSVDFTNANLDGANLKDARYSTKTRWPAGFDPQQAGAIGDR